MLRSRENYRFIRLIRGEADVVHVESHLLNARTKGADHFKLRAGHIRWTI